MKDILARLESPVVQIQLISIISAAIVFFVPGISESVQYITGAIIAVINIFAGLNNPTDKRAF